MLFSDSPTQQAKAAVRSVRTVPFWLDDPERPAPRAELREDLTCDLLVVGGGFAGLWAALLAAQADPGRSIVMVEAMRIAAAASGRNGGFVSHSLTHGFLNGASRWPDEIDRLVELGRQNLDEILDTIATYAIDCGAYRPGEITVALQPHQQAELAEVADVAAQCGGRVSTLDRAQLRNRVRSEHFLSGVIDHDVALVNPARLAWGLADAAELNGVRIFENTPVLELVDAGARVLAVTSQGTITARNVVLATNAFASLVPAADKYVVPVYDYALVTEPLATSQWEALGWSGREGLGDAGNQFHYSRPTDDGRILWGGYDAVYHRDRGIDPRYDVDVPAFERLAQHFQQTFPQLEGVRFTHGWGGAIDTCSRFAPFWGRWHDGKTVSVAGFTGLGVGSSRFAAQVMLDLLANRVTERTGLGMVRTKPLPFPPEPFRSLGINWTTKSLHAADHSAGRRNLWLRTLDRVGMGFAS